MGRTWNVILLGEFDELMAKLTVIMLKVFSSLTQVQINIDSNKSENYIYLRMKGISHATLQTYTTIQCNND